MLVGLCLVSPALRCRFPSKRVADFNPFVLDSFQPQRARRRRSQRPHFLHLFTTRFSDYCEYLLILFSALFSEIEISTLTRSLFPFPSSPPQSLLRGFPSSSDSAQLQKIRSKISERQQDWGTWSQNWDRVLRPSLIKGSRGVESELDDTKAMS